MATPVINNPPAPVEQAMPDLSQSVAPPAPVPTAVPAQPTVEPPAAPGPVAEEQMPDFSEFLPPELLVNTPAPAPVAPTTPAAPVAPDPVPADADARVYSDLPADVVPLFKKMGNIAFNTLKPVYLKALKLEQEVKERDTKIAEMQKSSVPENYYENERAYMLTPDFVKVAQDAQQAEQVKTHWQNQLVRIRAGEDIQDLALNPQTNRLELSAPIKVTPEIEARVMGLLGEAQAYSMQQQSALQGFAQTHRAKHTEATGWLQQFDKSAFAVFDKPESENLRKMAADTQQQFHKTFQNNPLAPTLARALVTIASLGNMLKQKAAAPAAPTVQVNGKNVAAADIRQAGPTATGLAPGAGAEPNITIEDFERLMQ